LVAFVDTSGLIKLYVPEAGSDWMAMEVRPGGIIISELAITETGATLSRLVRDGSITIVAALEAWRLFRRDLLTFMTVRLDRRALVKAAQLTVRSSLPLRTLDAIHLQAAQEAAAGAERAGLPVPVFISADTRLLTAAAALGFATDNPLDHP
jgi:predicted nucleic acid-binding protein